MINMWYGSESITFRTAFDSSFPSAHYRNDSRINYRNASHSIVAKRGCKRWRKERGNSWCCQNINNSFWNETSADYDLNVSISFTLLQTVSFYCIMKDTFKIETLFQLIFNSRNEIKHLQSFRRDLYVSDSDLKLKAEIWTL